MTEEQQNVINDKQREHEKNRRSETTEQQQKVINDKKREYKKDKIRDDRRITKGH